MQLMKREFCACFNTAFQWNDAAQNQNNCLYIICIDHHPVTYSNIWANELHKTNQKYILLLTILNQWPTNRDFVLDLILGKINAKLFPSKPKFQVKVVEHRIDIINVGNVISCPILTYTNLKSLTIMNVP